MMHLIELLSPWLAVRNDVNLTGIQNDSRLVKPGDVFLAYPGHALDGRKFMADAERAGAAVIVYDPDGCDVSLLQHVRRVPCIGLPYLSTHLAAIASRFYGEPANQLGITGVTGTNGKTTIAYQLAQAHTALGRPSMYLGTLGMGTVDALTPLNNTTPDACILQSFFHQAKQSGMTTVCMEVSSHALSQGRVNGVPFKQAIFTNLTHDHLDYHQSMAGYAAAKASLFRFATLHAAIVNADDAYAAQMTAMLPATCQLLSYGMSERADVRTERVQMHMHGTECQVHSPWGRLSFEVRAIGQFNVYNSLAILTSLLVSGHALQAVVDIMPELLSSPGRMEIVRAEPCVIVDYAHTPDALDNVLKTLVQLRRGRLIVVFGCGGDRDVSKRPLMGAIASRYADYVILTNDNPRTEDPLSIVRAIQQGMPSEVNACVYLDRELAIQHALEMAEPNDVVLIAGKGHEAYQQIGHERFNFSDQAVVRGFR